MVVYLTPSLVNDHLLVNRKRGITVLRLLHPMNRKHKTASPGKMISNGYPARRGTNGESTRERILEAAARLFAEMGFENASMPVIAKASGITAGAIYKHFE